MQTLYKLEPDELNENFLQSIKLLFAGKTVEISVREVFSMNRMTFGRPSSVSGSK